MNEKRKECLQCESKAVRKIQVKLSYGYFCLKHDFNSYRFDLIKDYLEQKTGII